MARMLILAIFFILSLTSCVRREEPMEISISYSDDKPVSVEIPVSLFPDGGIDIKNLSLVLSSSESKTPILGTFKILDQLIYFTPVIPFTRNFTYEVCYNEKQIDEFTVPGRKTSLSIPELLVIYPSVDTVPENLLKIHLKFSEKMSVMPSANYICMLNSTGDTLDHIFLQLEPELWNLEQTILTLWLEPGRIKEGLLPNQLEGIPIIKGNAYTIAVSSDWQSANGVPLKNAVHKTFEVGDRDEKIPMVTSWEIIRPLKSSKDPLKLNFREVLDYTSVLGSFVVYSRDGKEINGEYSFGKHEQGIEFIPNNKWGTGGYIIHIDGHVEDLAANNLNRLFDRDLQKDSTKIVKSDKEIKFEVH